MMRVTEHQWCHAGSFLQTHILRLSGARNEIILCSVSQSIKIISKASEECCWCM